MVDAGYYQLALCVLWFFIYSFAGWLHEVVYTYFVDKAWVNRGFVLGPVCPIYGFGALFAIFALSPFENPLVQFVVGTLMATAMEYATSWILERLFHARWWDYSNLPMNLNGRVSVLSSLLFGIMMVLVNFVIQPFINGILGQFAPAAVEAVALGMALLFVADLTSSVVHMNGLIERVSALQRFLAVIGRSARTRFGDAYYQARTVAGIMRDQMGETVSSAAGRMTETVSNAADLARKTASSAADLARETATNMRDLSSSAAESMRTMREEASRQEQFDELGTLLSGNPTFFERKLLRDPSFRLTGNGEAFDLLKEYLRGGRKQP